VFSQALSPLHKMASKEEADPPNFNSIIELSTLAEPNGENEEDEASSPV